MENNKTNNQEIVTTNYNDDKEYPLFLESVKIRFNEKLSTGIKLFQTDATGLYEAFLENIPTEVRQVYVCSSCRHFIERFGALATISDDGKIESVMWDESETPPFFKQAVKAMKRLVLDARVNGVFLSDVQTLGQPKTGEWHHLSAKLPATSVFRSRLLTAGQAMAEKREDFRMLINALLSFPLDVVNQAVTLLESETLYRSDKVLGVALWFRKLHQSRNAATDSRSKENIVWSAVATAPNGFCHIRSSMIGTLLEDIASGMSMNSVSRRFAEKMDPNNYMRSQTAPTGNMIQQAEKLVAQLGLEDALRRRYASFEEIPSFIWKKTYAKEQTEQKGKGVFGHLTPKDATVKNDKVALPSAVMTWEKFQRTIMPSAEKIEVLVDNPNRLMALVTAADENAENILQWNNPFSWYYHGGIDGEIKRRVESAGGRYQNNEIRCSLIWEGYTDLDLHVITPTGDHIYYGNKRDRRDGWLDIDMNGGGHRDALPVENIRWSSDAPSGRYKFYVHNYCERGKGRTPFKVELEVNGHVFSYNGVAGSNGYREDVFVFDYVKGQTPTIQGNSHASDEAWNIPANQFVEVKGITHSPNLWGEKQVVHAGTHVFFLLDGCKDLSEGKGRGFFNETLKPELREIRKTLELFTANTPIEQADEASACGVGYSKDNEWNVTVKVTSNQSTRIIKIDRWD